MAQAEAEPPLSALPTAVEKPVAAAEPPLPAGEKMKTDVSKALALVDNTSDSAPKKRVSTKGSHDRDIALGELDKVKSASFIKAWEDSEKSKADNKAEKKLFAVTAWENSKKASIEAQLRKIEEDLEKKKGGYAEKMRNKIAMIHKQAEEKKAMAEAKHGEELLKAEELAAKHRATGSVPKKLLSCF